MEFLDKERKLYEYLSQAGVYPDNVDVQTIAINSFYTQCELDNDDEWEDKIEHAHVHFELFEAYIVAEWIEEDEPSDMNNN